MHGQVVEHIRETADVVGVGMGGHHHRQSVDAQGPQGRPIPHSGGSPPSGRSMVLGELPVGETGTVTRVEGSSGALSFLTGEGVGAGVDVTMLAVGRGGDCLVQVDSIEVHIAASLAGSVLVSVP